MREVARLKKDIPLCELVEPISSLLRTMYLCVRSESGPYSPAIQIHTVNEIAQRVEFYPTGVSEWCFRPCPAVDILKLITQDETTHYFFYDCASEDQATTRISESLCSESAKEPIAATIGCDLLCSYLDGEWVCSGSTHLVELLEKRWA